MARQRPAEVPAATAAVGLARDDSEDVLYVVAEFASDAKQTSPILGTEEGAAAAELATKHADLGEEEAGPGLAASAQSFA